MFELCPKSASASGFMSSNGCSALSQVPGDRQLWPGTMVEVRREDPNDFHIPPGYPPTPPPPSTMDRCHKMGRTPRTRLPRLFSPFLTAAFSHRMVVAGMTLPVRL